MLAAHDVSGANEFLHEYNLREESTSRGSGGGSSDLNKATAPAAGTTTPGEDLGEFLCNLRILLIFVGYGQLY